jgi:deoxyribodipyrimidine photo-lyase
MSDNVGLFIFRRDLRTYDNTTLIELCKVCKVVYCLFVLDDRQINPEVNPYYGDTSFSFMLRSILDLKKEIPLTVDAGLPHEVCEKYIKSHKITHVGFNKDYTPFSIKRDKDITITAKKHGVEVISLHDACLNSPDDVKPYKVFTPYYIVASKIKVREPTPFKYKTVLKKLSTKTVSLDPLLKEAEANIEEIFLGGRTEGLKQLKKFVKDRLTTYKNRDLMTYETSRLGAHLKFGTLSIREVYYSIKPKVEIFTRQLYWRDFYTQIGFYFPHVYGKNFKGSIKWSNSKAAFKKWCDGETGYDIVDAAMTQLNKTGFMHNRGRMIVASFLTKLLHIDWRWGEKYFATKLYDYDPANNNGGWQWSAGTGVDAQPYFRIFNPMSQQEKFDPDKEYIEKWLGKRGTVAPIIDYKKEREAALKLYSK